MKRTLQTLLIVLVTGLAPVAEAQYQPWTGASVVNDPEWRKRFLGSYGFLSGAEPDIAPTEVEILREVIELIKVNPRAAQAMLAQQTGAESSAALDFILANLEFQAGELEAAAGHYESALEKFPDFRRAHKNLGLLRVQKGDFKGALEHLSRAVELGDRDGRNFGLIGYAYINLDNNLAAEVAYRNAILQEPDTKDWKLGLARALLSMQRYREAVALFDALLKEYPNDTTLWLLQANAFVGLDQPMKAAVNIETVRLLGKAQPSSLQLLGDIYMNAQMPELAKSAYLDVIESDQGATQFTTAYRAAQLLVRTRAYAEANEVLDSIEKRYAKKLPQADELKVLTLKAKVARAQGKKKAAASLLESIVERDGTRGDALLELAAYHEGEGNREKAILLFERAEKLDEFRYQALLDHARIMVSDKDYEKAARLLREATEIKREPRVERYLALVEQSVRPR
ncbi:MAG: tetratricopeptide repeat protein [Myxococcota bacterium]|nr:tetratricopeptide repeat protein [Myxococcota bacterium]